MGPGRCQLPSVQEISLEVPGLLSLHSRDLDMLVWLLSRHRGQELDLALDLPGRDLDMISFLLATIHSQRGEEDELTEAQRSWWRVAGRALTEGTVLTGQDEITLQHGRDVVRCEGLHGLDVSLTMKLANTFSSQGGRGEEGGGVCDMN